MTWQIFSLFGLTMATDFKFVSKLRISHNKPDFTFTISKKPPIKVIWGQKRPDYSSIYINDDGKSFSYIYILKNCDVYKITGVADFYIFNDRIVCHLYKKEDYHLVEIQFLGTVLSYWLERQGIPVIHASAVNVNGSAVAFISDNKGGKTSIAASLMQKGYPLITDDILPVEHIGGMIYCRSGYPTMRMWPDEAKNFLGYYEDLPIVHPELTKRRVFVGSNNFGSFHGSKTLLSCLYILERSKTKSNDQIEIKQLSKVESIMELVKHSFISFMVEELNWQPERLGKFSEIVLKVPVKRIVYPSGYENLPAVFNSILKDIERFE